MKTNISIETDEGVRDLLANYFDGKVSKRLASRKDLIAFVNGCVDMATQNAMGGEKFVKAATVLTGPEEAEVARLRTLGKNDSYIRGWIQVMRRAA